MSVEAVEGGSRKLLIKIDTRPRPGILLAGKVGFERLTHSTGQRQRASPSLLVTLTIKVVLSDAEEVHAISFRPLVLSAQRPGNVQRPSPL
jgi:hypothetical protein